MPNSSDIGLIGLAVMGQNLALNIADHDYKTSVYNRTYSKTEHFINNNALNNQNLVGFDSLDSFVESLESPKKIIIMVQAGPATDSVIDSLIPLLDKEILLSTAVTQNGQIQFLESNYLNKKVFIL